MREIGSQGMFGRGLKSIPAHYGDNRTLFPRGVSGTTASDAKKDRPVSSGTGRPAVSIQWYLVTYAGTALAFTCFFSQSVVDDFGRMIAWPMARATTACEQIPSERETEKSTV